MSITKITEEEVRALWVQRLPDHPNRTGRFGAPGLSAAEMKAAYDALPLRIAEHFNALVTVLEEGRLGEQIPSLNGRTLCDFFRDVTSGELASYLTVDGARTLSALAAALDTHTHTGLYAPLGTDGKVPSEYLPEMEKEEGEGGEGGGASAETLTELLDEIAELRAFCEEAKGELAKTEARLENLSAAAVGTTHTFLSLNVEDAAMIPPENALPYAKVLKIGGPSFSEQEASPLTSFILYGKNLLPFPYPDLDTEADYNGVSVTVLENGDLELNGTAADVTYIPLFKKENGLRLPSQILNIQPSTGDAMLCLFAEEFEGAFHTGHKRPLPHEPLFNQYPVCLRLQNDVTFQNYRVQPRIYIYGVPTETYIPWHEPTVLPVPDWMLALPGYGWKDNVVELDEARYVQRRSDSGTLLATPCIIPLDEKLVEDLYLCVEQAGCISFVNPKYCEMDCTILFGVKTV